MRSGWIAACALAFASSLWAGEIKVLSSNAMTHSLKELVARGEAELAVQQISEVSLVPGTQYAGPLPPELQHYTVFSAGISARTAEADAARAFLQFLASPAAAALLRAKGLEPPR